MSRLGLVATLSALILTGCVSPYAYRAGDGGDYYYASPEVEYYDAYGMPYGTIGYGYPGGWYGSFGYGFGYGFGSPLPYSRYGFPYWGYGGAYYGYPYGYYGYPYPPYVHHRPHRPHPPGSDTPPGVLPPGVIVTRDPPGGRPYLGDRENGPRQPPQNGQRPRIMMGQPGLPGDTPPSVGAPGEQVRIQRPRVMMSQPGQPGGLPQQEPVRRPTPMPTQEAPRRIQRMDPPAPPSPPPGGRMERRERDPGLNPRP